MVDTTAAVGGGAAVVTTRLVGRRFLLLPQIPIPIQQTIHTGIRIGKHVHTRLSITAPAIMPATEKEHMHMIRPHMIFF